MQPPSHRNTAGAMRHAEDRERAKALHRDPALVRGMRDDVERALALLEPTIEATIADRDVSPDGTLVVVVVDPDARETVAFEEAILVTRAFGRTGRIAVDHARHATDKARASHRERCDTSLARERGGALLSADLPLIGGLHRKGLTLGVSGAMPTFDEAIGAMVIELVAAFQAQRAAQAANLPPPKE